MISSLLLMTRTALPPRTRAHQLVHSSATSAQHSSTRQLHLIILRGLALCVDRPGFFLLRVPAYVVVFFPPTRPPHLHHLSWPLLLLPHPHHLGLPPLLLLPHCHQRTPSGVAISTAVWRTMCSSATAWPPMATLHAPLPLRWLQPHILWRVAG